MTSALLDDLRWRGLIADSTDEAALVEQLRAPTTLYYGCDPTAPSLHVGNLVGLTVLRRFQQAGHRVIALAGGATGFIGDPGERGERSLLSREVLDANLSGITAQLERFVDIDGDRGLLVNNLDWTEKLSILDFLRDIGKHFPVNVMLAKDVVRSRLSTSGISYTEFSYMLLQSLDYLELFRREDCRLQIGGSDQWGNLTAGVDLIRRVAGVGVHALSWPLVTSATGEKFSKSTGGGDLWLDPAMTSPYAFFQYWINVDDRDVGRYLRTFTFLTREQIQALEAETAAQPAARAAQRTLAEELTTLVHGVDETTRVVAASSALFGRGELSSLDAATLTAALSEAPHAELAPGVTVVDLLTETALCASKSDARRAVSDGGAYVNNLRIEDAERRFGLSDALADGWLVVRRGRRSVGGVRLTPALNTAPVPEPGPNSR